MQRDNRTGLTLMRICRKVQVLEPSQRRSSTSASCRYLFSCLRILGNASSNR